MNIAVGDTVTRTNNDAMPHDPVADDNSFQSPTLQKGESFSFTFKQSGEYGYHCSIHPNMKGKIVVK
jgi:plastocyanin